MKSDIDGFFLDFINLMGITVESYANIVKELADFQEKHEEYYEKIVELLDKPSEINDITKEIKKIDKEIFYRILELMFHYSNLDNKVRKIYSLSADKKRTLAKELMNVKTETTNLFKDLKKLCEKENR